MLFVRHLRAAFGYDIERGGQVEVPALHLHVLRGFVALRRVLLCKSICIPCSHRPQIAKRFHMVVKIRLTDRTRCRINILP